MKRIKLFVMDVDGTLTDGKIYMGQNGEEFKAFNIKDGCGILLLPKYNIVPIIITARKSNILKNRCDELRISELHQGVSNKLDKLKEIAFKYKCELNSVAYVGDDLPDIECMEEIKKSGGMVLCPSDAIPEIKGLSDYVSGYNAGEGSIRDCINYLIQRSSNIDVRARIKHVVKLILEGEYSDQSEGVFSDGTQYIIQEYLTTNESNCTLESHRSHIEIHCMILGREQLKLFSNHCLSGRKNYDGAKDTEQWHGGIEASQIVLVPGSIAIVMNNQPHKCSIQLDKPEIVRKLICKIYV